MGYIAFMQAGIVAKGDNDFIHQIRRANKDVLDKNDHRCWVIGDSEFVAKALEQDRQKRIRVAEYEKLGVTVETIAETVRRQMKLDDKAVFKRGRENQISVLRKIVAAISQREYGIPVSIIARYLGVVNSSVSRMLDQGQKLAKEHRISLKQ
jgi:hypothetical protein